MKTAIVYYSKHHGNTRKLLDAIAEKNEVTLIDVTEDKDADISSYERIGFASGIYYNAFARQITEYAVKHLPEDREVFYIYTHGAPAVKPLKAMRDIANKKNCKEIGSYHCQGFDTFGPFKAVGGIAKRHPTTEEIEAAVRFYQDLK